MSNIPTDVDFEKLKAQLILHEGKVNYAYPDSNGYYTIGIGHLIDKKRGGMIDDDTIYYIFNKDIEAKCKDLNDYLPWWSKLDPVRKMVLIDMCFNMGIGDDDDGLRSFHNTLAYIQQGQYSLAAKMMLRSKWALQVKGRAVRLAKMMETGEIQS